MVEVGQLELIGTLNTVDIERGQRRISTGFDNVETRTKSTVGAFNDLSRTSSNILTTFTGIGTVGVGALTALGLTAPAVARDLADMQITAIELGMAIGEIIQPAVQFVSEGFSRLSGFISENKDTIRDFVVNGIEFLGNAIEGVQAVWNFFKDSFKSMSAVIGIELDLGTTLNFVRENFPELFGAVLGYAVGGPRGAAVGLGAGVASRQGNMNEEAGPSEVGGGIVGQAGGWIGGAFAGNFLTTVALNALSLTPKGLAARVALTAAPYAGGFLGGLGGSIAGSGAGRWVGRMFDRNREVFDDVDTEGGNIGG